MGKTKLSVHKQMNERLLPVMAPFGFKKEKKGCYSRVVNRIYQFVVYKVETREQKEFIVQYGADYLGALREFPSLEFGGNFPDGWYGAKTEEQLNKSLDAIIDHVNAALLKWFDDISTELDYLNAYGIYVEENGTNAAGHSDFRLACLYAAINDKVNALKSAGLAKRLFMRAYEDYPTRTWAKIHADHCEELMAHLHKRDAKTLLDKWYELSLSNLGL